MTEPQKDQDEKERDEILRRMLKTPPKPHKEKHDGDDPKRDRHDQASPAARRRAKE